MTRVLLLLIGMGLAGRAHAQSPPPPMTVARLYDSPLRTIESELVPLAEAMPAEKYNRRASVGKSKAGALEWVGGSPEIASRAGRLPVASNGKEMGGRFL